jgi:two-component system, NarL family, vancomycin resistance associated response regulator VraR
MATLPPLTKIRVLVVDNQELVRVLLKVDLGRFADLTIVGTASNGREAVQLTHQLHPDVILMDLQMPVMDGLTASELIKQDFPGIQIIAYTSLSDPQVEVMAKTAPIDQFCYKDTVTEDLVKIIRECHQHQLTN